MVDMSGLHTLVDGLTFSPTSPDHEHSMHLISNYHHLGGQNSNVPASSSSNSAALTGSIFNNPNSSAASVSPRIQSFDSRRISYGMSVGSSSPINPAEPATPATHDAGSSDSGTTKEVDDPSSTPSLNGVERDFKYLAPARIFSPQISAARQNRTSSYRGNLRFLSL